MSPHCCYYCKHYMENFLVRNYSTSMGFTLPCVFMLKSITYFEFQSKLF